MGRKRKNAKEWGVKERKRRNGVKRNERKGMNRKGMPSVLSETGVLGLCARLGSLLGGTLLPAVLLLPRPPL